MPHIVRAPEFSEVNLRGVSAGHRRNGEAELLAARRTCPRNRVRHLRNSLPAAQAPATPAAPPPATPATPAARAEPTPASLPRHRHQPALTLVPMARRRVQANDTFTVNLQVSNAADFFSASPMRIKFDPKVLRLTNVKQGGLPATDGQQVIFTREHSQRHGRRDHYAEPPAGNGRGQRHRVAGDFDLPGDGEGSGPDISLGDHCAQHPARDATGSSRRSRR